MKKWLLFFSLLTGSIFAQIEKMEPPFWYAGMQNPEVQILFYGKNIAQYNKQLAEFQNKPENLISYKSTIYNT